MGFALLGLFQWMKRGSIFKVDRDIIMMGVFYAAVIFAYALFEKLSINVRPILIEGRLEPSYPSSTTMLVICVMSAAFIWADRHVKNKALKRLVLVSCTAFSLFMILARILSGVHWLTDIIGAFLLSGALVMIYNKVS